MSDSTQGEAAVQPAEEWVIRYTWPADDANPYSGPQTVHQDPAGNQAGAELRAGLWRDSQRAMGLKADAQAINLAAE